MVRTPNKLVTWCSDKNLDCVKLDVGAQNPNKYQIFTTFKTNKKQYSILSKGIERANISNCSQ